MVASEQKENLFKANGPGPSASPDQQVTGAGAQSCPSDRLKCLGQFMYVSLRTVGAV